MFNFITGLLGFPSKIKLWLFGAGGVAALLAAFKLYVFKQKKDAVSDFVKDEALKETEVRKDAKKASAKEKRKTDGLSDSDVADRLRRRSRDWERM